MLVNAQDKEKLISELNVGEGILKKLKQKEASVKKIKNEKTSNRTYLRISNRLFFNLSKRFVLEGKFKTLSLEIKKSNLNILTESYLSMILLSISISILIGIIFGTGLIIIGKVMWGLITIFAIPIITGFFLIEYPAIERKSMANKINQELPFAVIHMSAISGSGIEPSEIFKIIAKGNEYPNVRIEIRKILNQINVYGYDLITALNNGAKNSSSEKLSELFYGLSSTITSGGSMQEFFDKRSENLLLSYKLDRDKFTKTAETFMDIYISVAIAAPMILMLILIIISITGIQTGFSVPQLTLIIISSITIINLIFLVLLQLKQPPY